MAPTVKDVAEKLGGEWKIEESGRVTVVLTFPQAEEVINKMERAPHDGLLAVKYTDQDRVDHMLPPDSISFIYSTDGI